MNFDKQEFEMIPDREVGKYTDMLTTDNDYLEPIAYLNQVDYPHPVEYLHPVDYLNTVDYVHPVEYLHPVDYLHPIDCLHSIDYLHPVECIRPVDYLHSTEYLHPTEYLHSTECLHSVDYLHLVDYLQPVEQRPPVGNIHCSCTEASTKTNETCVLSSTQSQVLSNSSNYVRKLVSQSRTSNELSSSFCRRNNKLYPTDYEIKLDNASIINRNIAQSADVLARLNNDSKNQYEDAEVGTYVNDDDNHCTYESFVR